MAKREFQRMYMTLTTFQIQMLSNCEVELNTVKILNFALTNVMYGFTEYSDCSYLVKSCSYKI